jgi:uncharacterized iron-regulated protein
MLGIGGRLSVMLVLLASAGFAAATQMGATPPPGFTSPQARDHALAGRIWSVREGRFASSDELVAALAAADIVLLGEVHDNADHHAWQAWILDAVSRHRRARNANAQLGAVVFEHIRADQRQALDRFAEVRAEDGATVAAAKLFELLRWDESGWPNQAMFAPLFERALAWGLPILAGEASRTSMRAAAKTGASALDTEEHARLGLDTALDAAAEADLLTEIEESHCGMIPKSALANMAFAQRYRDAHLAGAAAAAATRHGASFLVAGNGHVRRDRGVPWHLARLAPERSIASVLMLEVEDGKTDPATYRQRGEQPPLADFIVFTPRAERDDPCEAWRAKALPRANQAP